MSRIAAGSEEDTSIFGTSGEIVLVYESDESAALTAPEGRGSIRPVHFVGFFMGEVPSAPQAAKGMTSSSDDWSTPAKT
jgi:hypothetical protein